MFYWLGEILKCIYMYVHVSGKSGDYFLTIKRTLKSKEHKTNSIKSMALREERILCLFFDGYFLDVVLIFSATGGICVKSGEFHQLH